MNKALLLTLGHNSSAILVQDGKIVCGYEQERLSKKKSDSAFPKDAILEIEKYFSIPQDITIYVSHWFLDGKLEVSKYYDYEWLKLKYPANAVVSLDADEFTHHDAHAYSAIAFAGKEFCSMPNTFCAVIDGFGTRGECLSIYKLSNDGAPELLMREMGFARSLGLLYQYATAYLGMKMNNHEYKMLAYEVHVHDIDGVNVGALNSMAKLASQVVFGGLPNVEEDSLGRLKTVQERLNAMFDSVLDTFSTKDADLTTKRKIISYYVQRIVEVRVMDVLGSIPAQNWLLCGGVFLNVKLNNMVAKSVSGKTCIMPLSGDQGAAIGVYEKHNRGVLQIDNLFWGVRRLKKPEQEVPGLVFVESTSEALPMIIDELDKVGFVNLVRGNMEFGPRALCNTTTLAFPKKDVAQIVNEINDRTNEMPFALVVDEFQCDDLFKQYSKIHKSLGYMICTRDFKSNEEAIDYIGGAHYYSDSDTFTCRPQILRDEDDLAPMLAQYGPLINTSFNFHGVPIVFDIEQIIYTHNKQREIADKKGITFKTIVVQNEV